MARPLTYRRHGRHRSYDRLNRRTAAQETPGLGQDAQRFMDEQQVRLDTDQGSEGVFDSMHLVQGEVEFFTFEDVRDADEADDIGLFSGFTAQTHSIDYDGTGNEALDSFPAVLGIANTWTFAGWFQSDDVTGEGGTLFNLFSPLLNTNRFFITQRGADAGLPLGMQFFSWDSTSSVIQNVAWTNIPGMASGAWYHVALTWNGLAGRKLYFNGVDQGAPDDTTTNLDGTMTDTARIVRIGSGAAPALAGKSASIALYDKVLGSAEIAVIYNGGSINFNLRVNSGSYQSAGNLQHWWQTGRLVSPDLGKDDGIAAVLIDLEEDAFGITDADRVADVPA